MLTEASFDEVIAHSPEVAPFSHEEAWAGSAGGAWKFWQRVHARRTATAPVRTEGWNA